MSRIIQSVISDKKRHVHVGGPMRFGITVMESKSSLVKLHDPLAALFFDEKIEREERQHLGRSERKRTRGDLAGVVEDVAILDNELSSKDLDWTTVMPKDHFGRSPAMETANCKGERWRNTTKVRRGLLSRRRIM